MLKDLINKALYEDNEEYNAIMDAVQPELTFAASSLFKSFRNRCPSIADADGIRAWEAILGIIADPAVETIEFRQFRVISRISSSLPYTERTLIQIMDSILGADGWEYELDTGDYDLTITSLQPGSLWLEEMRRTIARIIPANMKWDLRLYSRSWKSIYDDYPTWQVVLDTFSSWENVMLGIEV